MAEATEQTARNDVDEALDGAVVAAGEELLGDPRRLRAVVADLVGQPGVDHRAQVEAIIAVAEVWSAGDHRDEAAALAALRARDVDRATARWALGAIARHGATFASPPDTGPGRGRSRWLLPGGVAAAVVTVVAVLLLWPSPAPEPASQTQDSTSTPTDTGDVPPVEPEIVGYLVDFEPTPEGDVTVDREWLIRDGIVTGRVTLTPTGATGSIVNHRELIEVGPIADPRFLDATVVDASGDFTTVQFTGITGPVEFTFEASLTVDEFNQSDVEDWYAAWASEVVDLRPTSTDQSPAPASIDPITETSG